MTDAASKPKRPGVNTGPVCGAKTRAAKRNGSPCRREAGWGTDHLGFGHCKLHGGTSPTGRLFAAKQEAQAYVLSMGLPTNLSPDDALLACVSIAAGEVEFLSGKVAELDHSEAVVYPRHTKQRPRRTENGESATEHVNETTVSNRGELNVWIRARQDALDRLARFSAMAINAGIAERRIDLAERMGERLSTLIDGLFTDLQLSAAQKKRAPELVRKHLTLLEGGGNSPSASPRSSKPKSK